MTQGKPLSTGDPGMSSAVPNAPTGIKNDNSFRDDLKKGFAYAMARRAKLLPYAVAAAAFLLNNGLVHGTLAEWLNLAIALAGGVGIHAVSNAKKRFVLPNGAVAEVYEEKDPETGYVSAGVRQTGAPRTGLG